MSSAEPHLQEWYRQDDYHQRDGYPAELSGWVYDNNYLEGDALASNPGDYAATPVGESSYHAALTGHHGLPSEPFPAPTPAHAQSPGGWQSDVGTGGYFAQAPVGNNVVSESPWQTQTIDLTGSALTPAVQDLSPWGAASTGAVAPSCEPNLLYQASHQAPVALHAPFEVTQPPQGPMMSVPPAFGPQGGAAAGGGGGPPPPVLTPPCSASSDGTDYLQYQHHQFPHEHHHHHHHPHDEHQEQQHNFLCAFKRASLKGPGEWAALKQERKRASRRVVETRHRKKEREGQEQIKTTSKRLQDLNANLVAEERALMAEKINLMGELLTHAHCNDTAIAEYLSYASRD
ncbi:hypothetical protein C8A05DRAFT_39295, partial [Staphylotrichum tortipilum]